MEGSGKIVIPSYRVASPAMVHNAIGRIVTPLDGQCSWDAQNIWPPALGHLTPCLHQEGVSPPEVMKVSERPMLLTEILKSAATRSIVSVDGIALHTNMSRVA